MCLLVCASLKHAVKAQCRKVSINTNVIIISIYDPFQNKTAAVSHPIYSLLVKLMHFINSLNYSIAVRTLVTENLFFSLSDPQSTLPEKK